MICIGGPFDGGDIPMEADKVIVPYVRDDIKAVWDGNADPEVRIVKAVYIKRSRKLDDGALEWFYAYERLR